MEPTSPPAPMTADSPPTIKWYSRAAIDEYLSGATQERARLDAQIADANERLARASAALGLHQTMMEMLLESQRDVREIRRNAEAESARIIAEGERQAETILRARSVDGAAPESAATGVAAAASPMASPAAAPMASPAASPMASPESAPPDDAFFTYLKGALDEGGPLGPSEP